MNAKLEGLFPAIPTPFDDRDEFDRAALAENMDHWNRQPIAGVVAGGSNGEFVHLSGDEKVAVVSEARQLLLGDRILIAGAGELGTRASIQLAERLARAGADYLLVVSPFYYKSQMSPAALIAHYRAIADAAPVPIVLYNVPANTGLSIPTEAVLELCDHPQIAGLKDSSGDLARLAEIAAGVPSDFSLLAGSAGFLLGALAVGATGAISALANLAAPWIDELMRRFRCGDFERAGELQVRLAEPNRMVTAKYGVAGLKAALDMQGLVGGPVRRPLLALNQPARDEIRSAFERAGLWQAASR